MCMFVPCVPVRIWVNVRVVHVMGTFISVSAVYWESGVIYSCALKLTLQVWHTDRPTVQWSNSRLLCVVQVMYVSIHTRVWYLHDYCNVLHALYSIMECVCMYAWVCVRLCVCVCVRVDKWCTFLKVLENRRNYPEYYGNRLILVFSQEWECVFCVFFWPQTFICFSSLSASHLSAHI